MGCLNIKRTALILERWNGCMWACGRVGVCVCVCVVVVVIQGGAVLEPLPLTPVPVPVSVPVPGQRVFHALSCPVRQRAMTMTPFQVCTSGNLPAALHREQQRVSAVGHSQRVQTPAGGNYPRLGAKRAGRYFAAVAPQRSSALARPLARWPYRLWGGGARWASWVPAGMGPAEYRRAVAASPLLGVAHCNVQGFEEAAMCPKPNQHPGRVPATLDALPSTPRFPIRPIPSTHPHPPCLSAPGCSIIAPELLQTCSRIAPGALQTQRHGRAGDVLPGLPVGRRQGAPGERGPAWPEWLNYSTVNWPSRSGALHPLPSQPRSGLDSLVLFFP